MAKKVVILAFNGCHGFLYSLPIAIFNQKVQSRSYFEVKTCSEDGLAVSLDGNIQVLPDGNLELMKDADLIVIPGWLEIECRPSEQLGKALLSARENGVVIAGLCYGSFVLGHIGLLDGKRCTTHWMGEIKFKKYFPKAKLNLNALYADDDNIITSAGIAAGADCCLYLVRKFFGVHVANDIARTLVLPPFREGGQSQFQKFTCSVNSKDKRLIKLINELKKSPQNAGNIDELAAKICMSRRTFTRRFRQATGMSVTDFVLEQKLNLALNLLESSHLTIEEIAAHCGFSEATLLRRHFTSHFKVTPSVWRRTFGLFES